MTVSADRVSRIDYIATSGQTTYPYPFQVYASTDLAVYQNAVAISSYTVSGVGDVAGGNVILATGATAGDTVSILCHMPISQGVDYVELDAFPAETHERALDKLTIIAQQQQEELGRSLKFGPESTYEDPIVSDPVTGSYLRWSATSPPTITATTITPDTGIGLPLATSDGGHGQSMAAATGFPSWTAGTLSLIATVVDVAGSATGGAGTVADPWTGWDTAITWTAGYHYLFRQGSYAYATSPDWAKAGIHLVGLGDVRLVHTGTGNAIAIVAASGVLHLHLENLEITGNANTTNGLFLDGVHRSHIANIRINNVSAAGVCIDLGVANTLLDIRVAQENNHGDSWTVVPVNGILMEDDGGFSNTLLTPYIANVSGSGIKIAVGQQNLIVGGACEYCGTGLEIADSQWRNVVHSLDLESNTLDASIAGYRNIFLGINSDGTFTLTGTNPNQNILSGGSYNAVNIAGTRNLLDRIAYGYSGGALTDTGTDTQYRGVMNATGPSYLADSIKASAVGRYSPTYGASVAIDARNGDFQVITVTDGTAFTIGAPTNPTTGQFLTLQIKNTSGGAVGTITWNAVWKLATWTSPATGYNRSILFQYDSSVWHEISRTAADVPN